MSDPKLLTFLAADDAVVCDPETGVCEIPPAHPASAPA